MAKFKEIEKVKKIKKSTVINYKPEKDNKITEK